MESQTQQHQVHSITTLYHVFVHYIIMIVISCTCMISIDAEPEAEFIPEAEDNQCDQFQQGKQTPLIMSIKTHFPLILAYACLGCYHDTFLPHS